MDEAVIAGLDLAIVQYTANVTAGDFTPGAFTSLPSGETGSTIVQIAPDFIQITFGADIAGDLSIQYVGTDPPAVTPQTLLYT